MEISSLGGVIIPLIILDPTRIVLVYKGLRSTTSRGTSKLIKLIARGSSRGSELEVILAYAASTREAFIDYLSILL